MSLCVTIWWGNFRKCIKNDRLDRTASRYSIGFVIPLIPPSKGEALVFKVIPLNPPSMGDFFGIQ